MLRIENLHAYYGKSHVLHGVNLEIGKGEIVALLGRNGSGRSTTAKAIMGLVDWEGSLQWRGQALTGKKAYVLTARGGIYAGSPADHQEPYLRQVMAFIGIHDLTFIHAEGMNLGGDFQEKGLNQAKARVSEVA